MYNFTYSCSSCSLFIEPCCPHADKALPKLPIPHEKLNRSFAKPRNTMDCICVCSLLLIKTKGSMYYHISDIRVGLHAVGSQYFVGCFFLMSSTH